MRNKIKLSTVLKMVLPVLLLIVLLIIKFKIVDRNGFSIIRYAVVSVKGFNEVAEATVLVDDVGLYGALAEDDVAEDKGHKYQEFVDSVQYSIDVTEGLANGDTIRITTKYDKALADELGIKVGTTVKEYKVSGLEKGTAIDLFQDVKIITEGISPYVYVTYLNESKNEYLKGLEYSIDKASGLSIGDTITITCLIDKETARNNGFYYFKDTMTYTITTADRYVDKIEDLDFGVIEAWEKELPSLIEAETLDTTYHMTYKVTGNKVYLYRDNNEKMINIKSEGIYLANNNSGYEQEHENYVLVFYSGDIALPKYTTEADPYTYVDACFCFVYSDAIVTSDGKFELDTSTPWEDVICNDTFENTMSDVIEHIGKDYSIIEYVRQ